MTRLKTLQRTLAVSVLGGAMLGGSALSHGLANGQTGGDRMTPDQAKALKSPVPFTKQSIARGRITFSRNCTACHGADGKAQLDLVGNATDLTDPKVWQSGTAEGQIFRSVRDGAGNGMPPFKTQLHDEKEIWDLVNFIRSLWPEAARPKLQEDTAEKK